jgi:acetylornithine deacetylase/succinyl-diaminopimelate desuccinylase-like protein
MDVVGVGDEFLWTYPPFGGEIHDGKIYGRGSEDTKGHLAVQLIALRAIKAAGIELKGDLILTATVDDEIGQWPGMGYLIEKGFQAHGLKKPDYHIVGEPTGIENVGCLARGRLWYEIILKGVSAHGGNPKEGINAIEKAIALANAVLAYDIHSDPLMGADTINIGILRGGEAINIVPDRCKITFDIRPSTKKEVVKEFMDTTIQGLKDKDPDFVIESIRLLNDRQTGGIGPDHEFVKTVSITTVPASSKPKSRPIWVTVEITALRNRYLYTTSLGGSPMARSYRMKSSWITSSTPERVKRAIVAKEEKARVRDGSATC